MNVYNFSNYIDWPS